jgi:hypothetical protein
VRTRAITVVIDFFESKTFNAASVGAPRVDDGQSRNPERVPMVSLPQNIGWRAGRWQAIALPSLIEAPSGAFGAGDYRVIGRVITPAVVRIGYMERPVLKMRG